MMRPTDLCFRSPKEFTPGSYNPSVAFDGRKLSYACKGGKFPRERRFSQYDQEARKYSFRLGPGSYDPSLDQSNNFMGKFQPLVRTNPSKNGYVMIGNHLVLDDEYSSKKTPFLFKTVSVAAKQPYRKRVITTPKKKRYTRNVKSPYLASIYKQKAN